MNIKNHLVKFSLNHRKKIALINDFEKMDEALFLERLRNLAHVLDLSIVSGKKNECLFNKIKNLLETFRTRGLEDDGTIHWVETILEKYIEYKVDVYNKKKDNDIFSVMENRRSTREWTEKQVEEDVIREIIKFGMKAPVSCNRQAWNFVVFREDKSVLNHGLLEKAPAVILICMDLRPYFKIEEFAPYLDAGYCAENMTLAAESLGLSTCSVYFANRNELAKKLGLENYAPVIAVALGYPENKPTEVTRKNLEKSIIWK